MEMRDIEYFDVIARTLNLGQAAEIVGRTKPALTKCIRRLEEDIRAPLFVRSGRGIVLTAVGQMLRDRAGGLRNHADAVLREARDFAEGSVGHVRVGIGATPAMQMLPDIVGELIAAMPKVTMEIVIGIHNALFDGLRAGQLDLVVGPVGDKTASEFATHILLDDEVVVIACHDHPAHAEPPSLEMLRRHSWVLPALPAAHRIWLDEVFTAHKLPPPHAQIETNSIYLLTRLIAHAKLLSFMPRRHLPSEVPLREIRLPATTMVRKFGVTYKKHAYLPPAALRVVELLRANGRRRATVEGDR